MRRKITNVQRKLLVWMMSLQAVMAFATVGKTVVLQAEPGFTQQPQSQSACPGADVTFTVTFENSTILTYQWQKNGSNINGANSSSLSLNDITQSDYAAYRCVVTHSAGISTSDTVFLNTSITTTTGNTTCLNTPATIQVNTQGKEDVAYQWYSAATNTNTGGTIINGATESVYTPATDVAGTRYYYAVVHPVNFECASVTSSAVAFTVSGGVNAGNTSANVTICPGESTIVYVTGYSGIGFQWQQSTNGTSGWTNVTGGSGATTAMYTTPAVYEITYYRVLVSGVCGYDISDVVSVTTGHVFLWTGAENNEWNNPGNWSCNMAPTSEIDVIVPENGTNQPVVASGTAYARTLTIDDGTGLTIANGATLEVTDDIAILGSGSFVVENGGALVQINNVANNGIITVKQDSHALFRLDYTLWSAPVNGQQLLSFSPATVHTRFYEYKYDYTGTEYKEAYWPVNPSSTNFSAGKGFLIRMPNVDSTPGYNGGSVSIIHHGSFTGTPYNGAISTTLSLQGDRYTATGNPYASPINLADFFEQNASVLDSVSGIAFWRKKNNMDTTSYAQLTLAGFVANKGTVNATGVAIPGYNYGGQDQADYFLGDSSEWTLSQGQGFLVRAKEGLTTATLSFNNSMRRGASANGQAFFKSGQQTASKLWLNISNTNDAFSQAAVAYIDGATTGIDYGYDGAGLSDGNSLNLYTLAAGKNLAIQARPAFENTDMVNLGYSAGTAGTYTINLDHTEGVFAQGQKIYLTDAVTGAVTNLSNDIYSFTTEAGTFNNRFQVTYAPTAALSVDNNSLTPNNVIAFKNGSAIDISSAMAEIQSVKVFDIRGQQLYTADKISANSASVTGLQVAQQVVVLEINTERGTVTKKIVF